MDITSNYLNKPFESPFILASAPPTANADMISRAFEAGWAGAVIKTLIKEPVKNLGNRFASNKIRNQIIAFENIELLSEVPPDKWFEDIVSLKKRFPHKVIIGSIMGEAKNMDQWKDLALGCQQAGVDFIELNFSCPNGYPEKGKGAAIGQNADYSFMITKALKETTGLSVPLIPKLTPAVADISSIGCAVAKAGADGLTAINTFPGIMGFDLATLKPKASIKGYSTSGGYSGPGLKPIGLRCVSDLVKDPGLPIMACGGISSGHDAIEYLLLGAPIVQICTEVMINGYSVVAGMKKDLSEFMKLHSFSSVSDFVGLGNKCIRKFSELDQDGVVKASVSHDKCIGCLKCHVSCRDSGYQAISIVENKPRIDTDKCQGCSLCYQVCPNGSIIMMEG